MNSESSIPEINFKADSALTTDFDIVELDALYKRIPNLGFDIFTPYRVTFHHLIYISKGTCSLFIDFEQHLCQEGSLISIGKNQIYAFDRENRPAGTMLLFTPEFMDSTSTSIRLPVETLGFNLCENSPIIHLDQSLKASCENIISELKRIKEDPHHDRIITQLLFSTLILKLSREKQPYTTTNISESDRKRFQQFMSLIEQNYSSRKDASVFAVNMGVTYKTLNRICQSVTHKTPKQIIDSQTILEAKRRLVIGNSRISQLAYELGFEDSSNFVKYFKKHTTLTPNQFQKLHIR